MQSLDRRQDHGLPQAPGKVADPSSTFAALIAAHIRPVEPLTRDVQAHLVSPDGNPKLAPHGREIAALAFPGDAAAVESCQNNYKAILSGNTIRRIEVLGSSDYGRDFESVCYFVYYQGAVPVGIAGAYRYLDEPRRYWLGRIAVHPNCTGTGLGRLQLEHIASCVLRLGGKTLDAFTQDDLSNARVHAFYEKSGFRKLDSQIHEFGETQRVYRLELSPLDGTSRIA